MLGAVQNCPDLYHKNNMVQKLTKLTACSKVDHGAN